MWISEKRLSKIADEIASAIEQKTDKNLDLIAESTAIQIAQELNEQGFRLATVEGRGLAASNREVREGRVARTRAAYFDNSLGYSPVRHLTEFALGDGGISCPSVEAENDAATRRQQEFLQRFWDDPSNKRCFSDSVAQYQLSDKLQYDGELFLVVFAPSDVKLSQPILAVPKIRLFDLFDIKDPIITEPGDYATELAYWHRERSTEYNLDAPAVTYRDKPPQLFVSTIYPRRRGEISRELAPLYDQIGIRAKRGAWVYHQTFGSDPIEVRGWPATARIVGWLEKHRVVFRDAMQFLRSLLQFAWKRKVTPGTKTQLKRERELISNIYRRLATKAVAGSLMIEGQNVENVPINTPTGSATISRVLAKQIELMIGAGTGLPHNYLTGDISQGTLATAKSMELPVIKHARMWQSQLRALFEGVCNFVLWMKFKEAAGQVKVVFPPMLEDDIPQMLTAITQAATIGVLPFSDDPETGQIGATTMAYNVLRKRV